MGGILSGLESLGLGNLENKDIYEKKEAKVREVPEAKEHKEPEYNEADFIYDKNFKCPVCDTTITAKIMKTGKAKLKSTDFDLRPVYEGFAAEKYDVLMCHRCGYAALGKYFTVLLPAQAKMIKENISSNVVLTKYDDGDIYSYEQALERYKLALACSVVKKAKASEKAMVCLRTAWLMRSYQEYLAGKGDKKDLIDSLKEQEEEYESNAYSGFLEARESETPPIAGMDSVTLDYLLAQLAFHTGDYDNCSRMISGILTSAGANARIKDKVRDLKEKLTEAKH